MIQPLAELALGLVGALGLIRIFLSSTRLGPGAVQPGRPWDAWPALSPGGLLDGALEQLPGAAALRGLLAQAGNRASGLGVILLGASAGGVLAVAGLERSAPPWAVAGAALLAAAGPFLVLDLDRRTRSAQLAADLPGTLRTLSRLLGAGVATGAALQEAAAGQQGALAGELQRVAAEQAAGRPLREALRALAARAPRCLDLRILATAVDLSSGTELDLGTLLARIERRLVERAERIGEARARARRAQGQAVLVAALVPLAGALIFALQPDYLLDGWADPLGRTLYQAGAVWASAGLLVIAGLLRTRP